MRKARGAALKKTLKKLPKGFCSILSNSEKGAGLHCKTFNNKVKKTPGFMTTPPGYEGCVYVQGILLRSQSVGIED